MNASLQLVRSLVKDFDTHKAAYLAPDYQEQQARMDFIDKFFMALGWDVNHERQKNPYEQEVKIENRVHFSGSQRRADYAFFVAPNFRDVKFFVEAKKPYHDLERADYYHQTIRYGWNSGTPVAILTDFEEFHIIDCRYKPDLKTALDRKLKVYSYTDYADEQKFAEIFYLFGREAVANGSLEKYASSLPKRRGKAVQKQLFKGGYQQVDQAFLELLDGYRSTLASAFKAKNPGLDSEQLTEAVQRTIDRLVFIRFLEDKQIEDPAIIDFRSKPSAWNAFIAHCRGMEPKYNGLIFKHHRIIDEPGFHPPDEGKFADICSELADPASPYDFDKIPISILGSIYERFLGKVVHATEKRARVEEKPEVRKAGGVYYTPQYIVRYIVQQTVGKLIEGKTPEEIARMAFADIACGSGSFLLEVYDTLLQYHTRWYNDHPQKAKKGTVETRDGKLALSLKTRQEILTNNIYGVDIDFQATEVTQLSLYLKLLEDVTLNDAHQFSLLKEKMLPDLRRNIVCGNSLIEPDIAQGDLFGKGDESHLKPMRFEDAFPHVMKRGGFDAVVGNPPYVDIKGLQKEIVEYIFVNFNSANNRINIFAAFVERATNVVSKNLSRISLIVPTALLTQESYKVLRRLILDNYSLQSLVRIPNESFGATAGDVKVDTVIFVLGQRGRNNSRVEIVGYEGYERISVIEPGSARVHFFADESSWAADPDCVWAIGTSAGEEAIIRKCTKQGSVLEEFAEFSLGLTPYDKYRGHTRNQIEDRVFHANRKKNHTFKKLLAGNDVMRYFVRWNGEEWISYGPWLGASREQRFFTQKRILVKQIIDWTDKRIWATLTDEELYNTQNAFNLLPKSALSLEYLLGIINSKLLSYYHRKKYLDVFKMRFQKILIKDCRRFPIRTIDFSDPADKSRHDHIVKLVEQMLESKEKLAAAKTDAEVNRLELRCAGLDREIDNAVYELYGLTPEEIAIVEKG